MIITRNATAEDIDAMVELGALMHHESRFKALKYNPVKTKQFFDAIIGLKNYLIIVNEAQGDLIGGFIGYTAHHWFSDDLVASDLCLFLAPNHRGRLCAASLIKQYRIWAKEQGVCNDFILLGISTGIQVQRTEMLYSRLGFESHGILMNLRGDE